MNHTSRSIEKNVIEAIETRNPEIAANLKQNMFVFEDIIILDEKSIRKVLKETDVITLACALKSVNEKVKEYLLKNLSGKESKAVLTEMKEIGSIRLHEVENAQQKIAAIIRSLEDAGEIILFRADERIIE